MSPNPKDEDKEDVEEPVDVDPTTLEPAAPEEEEECLFTKAEMLYSQDKLSEMKQVLKSIEPDLLESKHHQWIDRANEADALSKDLLSQADDGGNWIDNGISKGKFPTRILYRLEEGETKTELRARCETPIKKELLESFLSVLNETELYETWLPSFRVPRFQVAECKKLKQVSRVSQILLVRLDLPWPMSSRELVLSAAAFDEIDTEGHIGIKLKTIDTGDDECVPEVTPDATRVDIDGGFLFTACPKDHPTLPFLDKNGDDDDEMVLVTFSACLDPKMKMVPQSFLNFMVKVALGQCWKILLQIAQDVNDGKRPDHANAIERKKEELYDYVNSRVTQMLNAILGVTQVVA